MRVVLVLTIVLDLKRTQIGYTAASMQAPLQEPAHIKMPQMCSSPGKVWRLKRSIYGLKGSPRNYFIHTTGQLKQLGFTQPTSDPCLFISPTVVCLVCAGDALLICKDEAAVNDLTKRMIEMGIKFEVESDVAGYLGVLIAQEKI